MCAHSSYCWFKILRQLTNLSKETHRFERQDKGKRTSLLSTPDEKFIILISSYFHILLYAHQKLKHGIEVTLFLFCLQVYTKTSSWWVGSYNTSYSYHPDNLFILKIVFSQDNVDAVWLPFQFLKMYNSNMDTYIDKISFPICDQTWCTIRFFSYKA